jgi:hypothetical protein
VLQCWTADASGVHACVLQAPCDSWVNGENVLEHTMVEGYAAIISDRNKMPKLGRPKEPHLGPSPSGLPPNLRGGGRCSSCE